MIYMFKLNNYCSNAMKKTKNSINQITVRFAISLILRFIFLYGSVSKIENIFFMRYMGVFFKIEKYFLHDSQDQQEDSHNHRCLQNSVGQNWPYIGRTGKMFEKKLIKGRIKTIKKGCICLFRKAPPCVNINPLTFVKS